MAFVALYSQGPGAATPSVPGPAALDQTVIKQLAMPTMQAEPRAETVAQSKAVASPIPAQPPESSGAVITGSEIMRAFSASGFASQTGTEPDKGVETPAPRSVEARPKSNVGQRAPLNMDIIRGLAMPAQLPVAPVIEPTAATPAPTGPDTVQPSEQPIDGRHAAARPTTDTQVAVSQRLAGVESATGGLAPAAPRPVVGQPTPLNVEVIRGLARDIANPAPRP